MAFQYDFQPPLQPPPQQQTSAQMLPSDKTTLWMGELEPWMDETFIRQVWYNLGEQVLVKLIRDKVTGSVYAFVDFSNPQTAAKVLATVNGSLIPNTHKVFKLNWASGGGLNDRREDRAPEYSLFVGDLSNEVSELMLLAIFQSRYVSCKSAKIMTDPNTGMPRGYGFVRFHDQSEQQRALIEMQGVYCGSRPMRVSMATPKNSNRNHAAILQQQQQIMIQQHQTTPPAVMQQQFQDPNNTTVFVGGLSSPVNEDELRLVFSPFGEITYVKIPAGKGCGFVQYVHRASAEIAIQQMNGFQINGSRIRLSWGRSQSDKTISQLHQQPPPPQAPQQRSQLAQPLPSASFVQQQQQQPQPLMPAVFRSPQQQPINFAQPSLTSAYSPYSGNSSTTMNRNALLSPTHVPSNFLQSQHLDTFDLLNRQADMGWPDVSKGLQSVSGPTSASKESSDPDPNWRINGIYAQ
ncbi:hypothetical protein K450DRAFT_224842 [Umbelopsis ramanniana AG]|uniref:RRM domain-containing protein n=1 Tax=Umbelopsis ramanniana AG TaxID=1314678 RepID=A0AAD5HI09_UMBRA|nr:uncharacterized protein K450DRAFT_224842 [Umbelopsis ramanniana AG]KAI8582798.1 hypothetical protein K450DRAFT_224842 [Umbelopsis ramanniana AG]